MTKPHQKTGWQFWIDQGGTFTDIIAISPQGVATESKLLTRANHYNNAPLEGMRRILGLADVAQLKKEPIAEIRLGTTIATNALLERHGSPTALLITRGFGDGLEIAYQTRQHIFARNIIREAPLYDRVFEISERVSAAGEIVTPLDKTELENVLREIKEHGYNSLAIVFVNAIANPVHELSTDKMARSVGFNEISTSSIVNPEIRFVSRGQTTVANAYLTPALKQTTQELEHQLGSTDNLSLRFMQSSGGLTAAESFRGQNAVLSGPAGGVVGMVRTCEALGIDRIIGFDMGGTSTDVSLYDREFQRKRETRISGIYLRTPALSIHTVAAGGGSKLYYRDDKFQAGPESAGALPGPACYRNGGPATVTDANVVLGRIQPQFFPACFGKGNEPVSVELSEAAIRQQISHIDSSGRPNALADAAQGFLTVAVNKMAAAIRKISTNQGIDPADYTLACFGGAGGQHACAVAEVLGIQSVIIHPQASTMSAIGIGMASQSAYRQHNIRSSIETFFAAQPDTVLDQLEAEARAELLALNVANKDISVQTTLHLRTKGSDRTISVALGSKEEVKSVFAREHRQRFGFWDEDTSIVVETISMLASDAGQLLPDFVTTSGTKESGPGPGLHATWFEDRWLPTPFIIRSDIDTAQIITGPAVIVDQHTSVIIQPGWQCKALETGALHITPTNDIRKHLHYSTSRDPVALELFSSLYMFIAEQMGSVLQRTAYSVNIKERLDFSCAIFTGDGDLIANAPHMPVHLGSMGDSVRAVISQASDLQDGDTWILNSPYNGGTHLPDITAVSPVYAGGDKPLFYVASRGHHADVGGITPGSMPAHSNHIDDEGVLIDPFLLTRGGQFYEDKAYQKFAGGPYPARNPAQNIADLKAQVAANQLGIKELQKASTKYGIDVVRAYAGFVLDNGETVIRNRINKLSGGSFVVNMDNGCKISVQISVDRQSREVTVDFAGTSAQQSDNYNAPSSVCRAAVLYVFRTLIDHDIPINDGCLRPVTIDIPPHSLLSPVYPAAVAAGNVETSQCITDALFGAFELLAASQGTMNNLTFGNQEYQYYETICGGAGAGPDHPGADAIQTHMTNSSLTDVEILESRFPVRVNEFSIRRESGGSGAHCGGNGVVRRLEFLDSMDGAILAGRRLHAPFGLRGGKPAKPGETVVIRALGEREILSYASQFSLNKHDQIEIKTPGGGGFGKK